LTVCGGVKYKHGDQTVTTCFPNPKAAQRAVYDRWPRILTQEDRHG